jgi:DNA/RNA endonuclease YhcR with UshA esterase domain
MKILFSILAVLTFAIKLFAGDTNAPALLKIGAAEADKYYDQEMIVTGKVAQITIRPSVTFLNLDKPFPDSPFTIVIFHKHSSFYGDANALKGKSIEIKGTIKNYKDKPEIALDKMNQLTVIGVTNLELLLKPKNVSSPTNAPTTLQMSNAPPAVQSTNFPEIM